MIEFSYWLFPMIFIIYLIMPITRTALIPGLLAACVAGAANSTVINKPLFAWGHAAAAMIMLAILEWKRSDNKKKFIWDKGKPNTGKCRELSTESTKNILVGALTILIWAGLAAATTAVLPDGMWPYKLSKSQMVQLFVMFLPLGIIV